MKKKTVANIVMVAIILVIAAAGVLGVGYIRGWFDADDGTYAVVTDVRGVMNLERDGVSYPAQGQSVLRKGDKLSCAPGATAVIRAGKSTFTVGGNTSLTVTDPSAEHFAVELISGEVFADCGTETVVTFSGQKAVLSQATALLSVRSGAQSISVLRGKVDDAEAGQMLNYVAGAKSVTQLRLSSLNDFTIDQIRGYTGGETLCFTAEDLDVLMAERQQALQDLINSQTKPETPDTQTKEPDQNTDNQSQQSGTTKPAEPDNTTTPDTETKEPANTDTPPATTDTPSTQQPADTPTTTPDPAPPAAGGSCTITIRCDTILENMGDLEPGKAEFVPSSGVILYPVTVNFEDGETVFDVLNRVCKIADIQIEYSWTPLYNSYYIEGINHLYEFDCGEQSGWMYKVNEWFPNYGCSSYYLSDGDVIVWCYTCKGLGADVGDDWMARQ